MAYNIIFYEKQNGKSEVFDFLENLRIKSSTSKDARQIASFTFTAIMILMFSYTAFVKNQRKLHVVKLIKQKQSAMIIYSERKMGYYEKLE